MRIKARKSSSIINPRKIAGSKNVNSLLRSALVIINLVYGKRMPLKFNRS